MDHIEYLLLCRMCQLERDTWRAHDEEALLAHEKTIFAALVGPSDPIPYEAMFPKTVARMREAAARQHHLRHLRDAVGHTRPLLRPSAAAVRMLLSSFKRSGGGLHSSGRSVRPRVESP
jgi:hypothetical protein